MGPLATALLVDPDPTTADILRAKLADEYAFDVAYDAATAIRCLASGRYRGVIVDLGVPHSIDVLRHAAVPTVVISHRLSESVRTMLAQAQVKLVLPKPVETWLLALVLRGLCALSEAGTPLPLQSSPPLPTRAPRSRSALPPALPAERELAREARTRR